jgi:(p)ppGpp synthase/HD superfamily hydrolase
MRTSQLSDGMVLDALLFAAEKHGGQTRKGSGLPYVSHPIAVSYIVAAYKSSKNLADLVTAAILHDLLEDTEVTFIELATRFNPLVASLVLELSSDRVEIARIGKLEYLKRKLAGISSYGLVIKLADRLHNVSDQPTDKTISDTVELLTHIRTVRKLSKTQNRLVDKIMSICENNTQDNMAC